MPRFEITGTATDTFTLEQIQAAITAEGAERVNARNAFGWSNQPKVATFAAACEAEAKRICDKARERLGPGCWPSLHPYAY